MKYILNAFRSIAAVVLLALAVGCASHIEHKQNMAVAAGFKVITPTRPDQQAILARLPADKVTPVRYHGKLYYVLPDLPNNQAYVGGPRQYQAYQQLRLQEHISNQNLMAAQMNESASMNWGAWGGWGMWGPGGWY